jgi:hypothetical protein
MADAPPTELRRPVLVVSLRGVNLLSDPWLERVGWGLAIAVLGLILREAWQAFSDRKAKRRREQMLLTALAREVIVIRAVAAAIINDVNKERKLLNEEGRWRLKPLLTLPTGIYEVVRGRVPERLLEQEIGFVQLVGLQTQCTFTNQVAAEHREWRSPAARDAPDQLEVIRNFHPVIGETLENVIRRCDEFIPTLEAAAKGIGGLALKPVQADSANAAVGLTEN